MKSKKNKNHEMLNFKKGKFNLTCWRHGHSQDRPAYKGQTFKCYRCGATWSGYKYWGR